MTGVELAAVAKIGVVTYDSLEDAIAAAETNDTVEVLKDLALNNKLVIDQNITLTSAGENAITIKPAATASNLGSMVQITGSATLKNIVLDGDKKCRVLILSKTEEPEITVTLGEGTKIINGSVTNGSGGGGVAVETGAAKANLIIDGAEITGNSATGVKTDGTGGSGGGVFFGQTKCDLTIKSGTISNNHAELYAGGVWIASTATGEMLGGTVS